VPNSIEGGNQDDTAQVVPPVIVPVPLSQKSEPEENPARFEAGVSIDPLSRRYAKLSPDKIVGSSSQRTQEFSVLRSKPDNERGSYVNPVPVSLQVVQV